jgi:hypothetical protein
MTIQTGLAQHVAISMTSLPDLLTLYRNYPRVARIAEGL